jgi:hypothetical protein
VATRCWVYGRLARVRRTEPTSHFESILRICSGHPRVSALLILFGSTSTGSRPTNG